MDHDYEHHQLYKCCLVSFRNTDGVLLNTNINVKCLQNHLNLLNSKSFTKDLSRSLCGMYRKKKWLFYMTKQDKMTIKHALLKSCFKVS